MTRPIRVLHLEDSPRDAELIHHQLDAAGVRHDIVLVGGRDGFEEALGRESFDVVLTDFNLPDYDGTSAIRLVRERQPGTPVIVISGTLGEEEAVRCLHEGATDYVLKQRLTRLAPAVYRAIHEAAEHRARLEAEIQLREINRRFQQLAEQSTQGFWFAAADPLQVLYVSPAVERIWGRPREAFYQDADLWFTSIHPDDAPRVGKEWEAAFQNSVPSFEMEYRVVRPDGSICWIVDSGTLTRKERGGHAMLSGIVTDITERKQLEAQFHQAQKLENVGQLAGGIAHDFNNLLTIINGVAALAFSKLSEGDPVRDDLQEIHRAGERAAALTQQLLAFSRRQILQPQVLNLNTVVEKMEDMLRRLLGEDVDLVVVLTQGLGRVKADKGQIEQVLTNLAVNARDAMPRGGQLTIETQHVTIDEPLTDQLGATMPPGPYVMLTVSDTGMGMDEVTRKRIFEPFFTTKEQGRGTGLGLSTVYGIVKQSGGFVSVYSEVGQGTSLKVYLPQTADETARTPSRPTVASVRGTETILVVEDMAGLRHLATRMLESAGYTVLTAANGEEALRLLESDGQPVHLLLTDVVMPGMSGRILAERFRTLRPASQVLYVSGYTDDVIVRHGVLDEGMAFLGKPFTAMELTQKVREVLDARPR